MGKRSLEEQKKELETKRAQIDERLRLLNAQEAKAKRKIEDRKKIIVGAIVLAAAQTDSKYKDFLLLTLRRAPKRPQDEAIIASIIADLEAIQPAPTAPDVAPLEPPQEVT